MVHKKAALRILTSHLQGYAAHCRWFSRRIRDDLQADSEAQGEWKTCHCLHGNVIPELSGFTKYP